MMADVLAPGSDAFQISEAPGRTDRAACRDRDACQMGRRPHRGERNRNDQADAHDREHHGTLAQVPPMPDAEARAAADTTIVAPGLTRPAYARVDPRYDDREVTRG